MSRALFQKCTWGFETGLSEKYRSGFCFALQPFNLLQVIRAMHAHPFHVFSYSHFMLQLRVIGRLIQVTGLQAAQQLHIVVAVEPVQSN